MLSGKIGYFRETGPVLDADAVAYLARVEAADGQALEPAVRLAVSDFVAGCKADGNWSAIKASCILMGARTLSGALEPLVGSAPTNNNFVAADYNRKTGLKNDTGGKWLNANRNSQDDPLGDHSLGVWATELTTVFDGRLIGSTDSFIQWRSTFTLIASRSGANTQGAAPPIGFFGFSRFSTAQYTRATQTTGPTTSNVSAVNYNNSVTILFRSPTSTNIATNLRLSFYWVGTALANLISLRTRLGALNTAINSAIP